MPEEIKTRLKTFTDRFIKDSNDFNMVQNKFIKL